MQINIDKKTGILTGIIIVLLAIIIGMGMSRSNDGGFFRMHGFGMMDSDKTRSSKDLTGADIMFLQMMIPHHQQAVDISELAITRSKDAELIALATDIRDGQKAEIVQMKSWLREANADIDMGHSMGNSMGGMLDDQELADLESASGTNFDLLWLEGMINHHDGALHMSTMIKDARNSEIKRFGENVISVQTTQIEQMKIMINRLS
jgi:uncharacterized protein (DUF305 family)